MRRILVDAARGKHSLKRGSGRQRQPLDEARLVAPRDEEDILAVDEALGRLAAIDAEAAALVKLRFFAGLTSEQAAEALGVSARTGDRIWAYARAFLLKELKSSRD
jgi:RNA polymerase sigma factor (TIGR02999 family)